MSEYAVPGGRRIFTIGHSNHSEQTFLELLRQHQIEVVADIRSQPYAKYAKHFSGEQIRRLLAGAGIQYVFLGQELGGRPAEPEFYDADGHVRYDRLAVLPLFQQGIQRLETGIQKYRVVLMCSEESPLECHRNLLVGCVLAERGVELWHVRGDGRLQTQKDLQRESRSGDDRQLLLFHEPKERAWRSVRSVLPKPQQPISSAD